MPSASPSPATGSTMRPSAPRSTRPATTSPDDGGSTTRSTAEGHDMSATDHHQHVDLPITGMTCASCANRIERKLNKLDGVSATVNYATEKATVDYDPEVARPEDLLGAVEAAGYEAVLPAAEA